MDFTSYCLGFLAGSLAAALGLCDVLACWSGLACWHGLACGSVLVCEVNMPLLKLTECGRPPQFAQVAAVCRSFLKRCAANPYHASLGAPTIIPNVSICLCPSLVRLKIFLFSAMFMFLIVQFPRASWKLMSLQVPLLTGCV